MSRRRHRSSYSRYDRGHEAAKRHIREAREFSQEIGGSDQDVKKYFFGLPASELEPIFQEYGREYGAAAEAYARETLPRWKSGVRKMSGLVAKRLFGLLPPRMPLSTKYELAESVWKHFGPSSSSSYMVGPNAPVSTVVDLLNEKLDQEVANYSIPPDVQRRFNWLSDGDMKIHEQLLNHFRNEEKILAVQKIEDELPVLQRQVASHSDKTHLAKSTIKVHRHEIGLWVLEELGEVVKEGRPTQRSSGGSWLPLIWWVIGIGVLITIFSN